MVIKKTMLLLFALSITLYFSCAGSKNSGKIKFVSIDEELELGRSLTKQMPKHFKIVRNQQITDYFTQIAREIGTQSDWDGLTYSVYVINEDDINHFSLPGGSIYLFRGLIEASENMSEIALIIAHEIVHIAERNAVDRIAEKYAFAFAAQSVIGENPEIATQIIEHLYSDGTILDYPEDQEFLADAKAINYAWKTNYSPDGLLDILRIIGKKETDDIESVALLLTTHPATSSRYRKVRQELSKVPVKSTLRTNDPEFSNIKKILTTLPR